MAEEKQDEFTLHKAWLDISKAVTKDGWTQQDVADALDVTVRTVRR